MSSDNVPTTTTTTNGSRFPPRPPKTLEEKQTHRRVIVILDQANLEIAKVGKQYVLLNGDEHHSIIAKNNKDPADYRPDITHQVGCYAPFPLHCFGFPDLWLSPINRLFTTDVDAAAG
jgi:hypothetical protein